MNKFWKYAIILCCLMGMFFLAGCQSPVKNTEKPRVVTTLFPPYDFAREVAGDKAEITLLLKPGTESHSYEPSPADILLIESCDLFIYNGGESDTWVDELLATIDTSKVRILKMMDAVDVLTEESVEGMQGAHHHEEEEHSHEYDEHIWTSPKNAMKITQSIAEAMKTIDPENGGYYQSNLDGYLDKLGKLDQAFTEIVENGVRDRLIFGDRFPFRYFAEEYGLSYRAAFPGCSAASEPGAKTVAYLIDAVREERIPVLFYIEFSNQKIANTIAEETGAKPLLFHSCHNVSPEEMEEGVSYLKLMEQNKEHLKEALTDELAGM